MKTILPESIDNAADAERFLKELHNNGEAYHPEDDARDIMWPCPEPTAQERDHLNRLMQQMWKLQGFDPCEVLLKLI